MEARKKQARQYLSPVDIAEIYSMSDTTAREHIRRAEEQGAEVIRIGRLIRISQIDWETYLTK